MSINQRSINLHHISTLPQGIINIVKLFQRFDELKVWFFIPGACDDFYNHDTDGVRLTDPLKKNSFH